MTEHERRTRARRAADIRAWPEGLDEPLERLDPAEIDALKRNLDRFFRGVTPPPDTVVTIDLLELLEDAAYTIRRGAIDDDLADRLDRARRRLAAPRPTEPTGGPT